MTRTARQNYDRLSRWYDWFAGSEKRFTEAGLRLLDVQPDERVLEIGPGTGHGLVQLAESGARACGLDLSAGMLARAQWAVTKSGREAQFCQGDALTLPFPARSFDAIFLSFTLELFRDAEIPSVLRECQRVLRQEGRIGVVALAKEETGAVRLYEWFHRCWPQVVDCCPIRVHAVLIAAGFEVREAWRMVMWGLPVEIDVGTMKFPQPYNQVQ
jgi:demethylmenaquinone methyltransferase/2-methoxy-6-polyprenyl-1,4-benzoquinol methylase